MMLLIICNLFHLVLVSSLLILLTSIILSLRTLSQGLAKAQGRIASAAATEICTVVVVLVLDTVAGIRRVGKTWLSDLRNKDPLVTPLRFL